MPCIIRKDIGDRYENCITLAGDEWALRPQVESLDRWLQANPDGLDPRFQWVADIGFTPRVNALGGGPVLSRELMERCLKANLEIFFSEYAGASQ